jgi:hypothetical protein
MSARLLGCLVVSVVLGAACQCGRVGAGEGDGGPDAGGSPDSGSSRDGGENPDSGAGQDGGTGPDGGGGGDAGRLSDGGCPDPISGTLYVDATTTAGGNGSKACPFVTITDGLAAVGAATTATIIVEPGTYNAALGETFPLEITGNVKVTGDVAAATSRAAFIIDGTGPITLGGQSFNVGVHLVGELSYMTVNDSAKAGDDLIAVDIGTPRLTLATVSGGTNGILVTGESGLAGVQFAITTQCDITGALQDGIVVDPMGGAAPTLTVTQTLIHNNGNDGVRVVSAGGAGAGPSVKIGYGLTPVCSLQKMPNACDIYCNTRYGVENAATVNGVRVEAEGNAWHNDPPTTGNAPADVNSTVAIDDGCPATANPTVCR